VSLRTLDCAYLHDATELSAIDGKPLATTAEGHSLGGTLAQIQTYHLGIRVRVTVGRCETSRRRTGARRSDIRSLHRSSTHL